MISNDIVRIVDPAWIDGALGVKIESQLALSSTGGVGGPDATAARVPDSSALNDQ